MGEHCKRLTKDRTLGRGLGNKSSSSIRRYGTTPLSNTSESEQRKMASWSSPVAAAALQVHFGSSCFFSARSPRQTLLLPPLARNPTLTIQPRPHPFRNINSSSSSSWMCHAVAAEVEGLNIADDVTQAISLPCALPTYLYKLPASYSCHSCKSKLQDACL